MVEKKPTVGYKMAGPAGPRPPAAATLTPKEVFGILRRRVLLIVIVTVAGLAAGVGMWKLLEIVFPKYTAQTLIQVLPPIETDPMDIVAAQVQKDIQYGYRVSMANLLKQQSSLQELIRDPDVRGTNWFKRRDEDPRKAFKYLSRHLNAQAHRDAEYVVVSMTCRQADEAARMVNVMANKFVASQGGTKRQELRDRLTKLEDRRASVEKELLAANTALDEVRKHWEITDLERTPGRYWRHTYEILLDDLALQENELLLAVRQSEANMKNLDRLATGPVTVQIKHAVERDQVMLALAQQLALQEAQLAGRLAKFGDNHRVVRQTRQLIEEIKAERELRREEIADQTRQAILKNAQDGLLVMQERLAELQTLREAAAKKKMDLDLARVQYERRLKTRDERILMLDAIKAQIEKLRIMVEDPEAPKVMLVGDAPEPLEMVASRQWWLWLPSGTVLGFLIGIGLAFLLEMVNDLLRTPRDVTRFVPVPLLGVIPDAAEDKQVRGIELCHAVRQAPYSLISESYRRCRTNLELSSSAESSQALLVVSGDAGDGKTSVAVNLATAFVAKDKKVLLIDANFRQPSLQTIFPKMAANDLETEHFNFGLSSVLTNQCSYRDAVRPTSVEGLDVIDTGPLPSNPAELLAGPRMAELVKEHRKNYDHVIIDSAPLLLVSDGKALARLVDATLVVFNAAATRRGAAQRTIRELKEVDATIVGCVLLGVRAMKGGYFQEQYKSYQKYQKPQFAPAT
jgi:succinoglycan biosynthesis transport protein ExoP